MQITILVWKIPVRYYRDIPIIVVKKIYVTIKILILEERSNQLEFIWEIKLSRVILETIFFNESEHSKNFKNSQE